MKLADIKFGFEPDTHRVCIGTVSEQDPGVWTEKRYVVNEMCHVILGWIGPDGVLAIEAKNGARFRFEVTVKQVEAGEI